jgi:hypothetical protein
METFSTKGWFGPTKERIARRTSGMGAEDWGREGIKIGPPRGRFRGGNSFLRGQLRSVFFGFGSGFAGFSHL